MFLVTAILFFLLLQLPAERRAEVYIPSVNPHITEEEYERLIQVTIERYGLNDPFYVQYSNWIQNLFKGDWGFSSSWRQPVLEGLLHRLPASIELGIFAMIPSVLLAILLGGVAAVRKNRLSDYAVRLSAFVGWAIPNYIFGLIFMTVFYAWLGWFRPERLSYAVNTIVNSENFQSFTGFLILDGILNHNPEVTWDAIRHLMLPGITLAVFQWALFVRIMRSSLLEELMQDYVTTARSKLDFVQIEPFKLNTTRFQTGILAGLREIFGCQGKSWTYKNPNAPKYTYAQERLHPRRWVWSWHTRQPV